MKKTVGIEQCNRRSKMVSGANDNSNLNNPVQQETSVLTATTCRYCNAELTENAKYCKTCGRLVGQCPHCSAELKPEWGDILHCPSCGKDPLNPPKQLTANAANLPVTTQDRVYQRFQWTALALGLLLLIVGTPLFFVSGLDGFGLAGVVLGAGLAGGSVLALLTLYSKK